MLKALTAGLHAGVYAFKAERVMAEYLAAHRTWQRDILIEPEALVCVLCGIFSLVVYVQILMN